MKKMTWPLLLALGMGVYAPADAKVEHILPYPHAVKMADNAQGVAAFKLAKGSVVTINGIESNPTLVRFFAEFGVTAKFDAKGNGGQVKVTKVQAIKDAYNHQLAGYDNEAYQLTVGSNGIEIQYVDEIGVTRAAQTLTQMAEGWDESGVNLEAVSMVDWPAFKLRGIMHDVGRSFIEFEELKKHVDLLSRFKVNTFHWHLTENLAWRFEIKAEAYKHLTDDQYMTRQKGKFYTQEQCKELVQYAAERGVTIIPEIDMPGHSKAFRDALGYDMQSEKGKVALKVILKEVVDVFTNSPYIHIGGDEQATTAAYLNEMIGYVKNDLKKKVVVWNPIRGVDVNHLNADMCQLWSTAGRVIKGKANIDCRYNYTNHFDVYADLVGIYKSNIYYEQKGTKEVAGSISATWNDTKTLNDEQLVKQNNIYANAMATAERAWKGGGKRYVEVGGTSLPNSGEEYEEFADFERRFLFHKNHALKNEPIPYVKQTNVRWRITDPFPNDGNRNLQLPPELEKGDLLPDTYQYKGNTYATHLATGAGIYLRHIWHPTVPSFYSNPANNQTAYAWTYVYAPKAQKVGAQIEFYTYSRSGNEKAPDAGQWDRRGSKVWVNGKEVKAPNWKQPGKNIPQDHATEGLIDENYTGRPVVQLELQQGWNKVFMRLPHVNNGGTGRDKWQFTFVFTDPEGKNAVEGLIYSPNKCKDEAAEMVAGKVGEVKAFRNAQVKDQPGYYAESAAKDLDAKIAAVEKTYSENLSGAEREAQLKELEEALQAFQQALAAAEIIQPKVSEGEQVYYYTLSTPLRENRYATSRGAGADMVGETAPSKAAYWKFVSRTDGDYNLVNYNGTFVSPESGNNTALKTQAEAPKKGWKLGKADATGFFIITSGTAQFNQTNNGQLGYKVYNWGSGTNTTDTGCKYAIKAVDAKELETDPSLPQDGKLYYFYNKHKKGDQYFYDNGGQVGFSAQKMDQKKSFVWVCEETGNGNFYFKNLLTHNYFAWKSLSSEACEWKLDSKKDVKNPGCVTMQAVHQPKSNFMVCVQGGFDQAGHAGYYDDKFSSDFKFELCNNKDWESETPAEPISYYCDKYGDNWVRMVWDRNTNDAAGLVTTTGALENVAGKSNPADLTCKDQLWAFVGDENGFLIQNAAAGENLALHVSTTAEGAEAHLVKKDGACKWVLVKKGNSYAITPSNKKDMSLNSFGGARMNLKLYNANDGGSKWQLQSGIVPALKMAVEIEGENPYGDVRTVAGNLRFAVNGQAMTSAVYTDAMGENTYYLPAKAKVMLTQAAGSRGFANGGLFVNGKSTDKVQFTVGDETPAVKALFKASLDNGMVLYFTPGPGGHPYRIPAIATAMNGDIVAISDYRPGGADVGRGEVDIKYRMSTDNGKTWGEEKMLADGHWGKGEKWQYSFGDAAVVADRESNRILVMMVCGNTNCNAGNYDPNDAKKDPNRVARCYGTYDEGTKTWTFSQPENVTESIYSKFVKVQNGRKVATVRSLFIGSGRICQSRVTKVGKYYRLYAAVWTRDNGNRVIYSDDFGGSWNVLGSIDDRPGTGGDEPKCEELPNGDVILSSRNNGRVFNIYKFTDREKATGFWGKEQWSEGKPGGISVGNNTNGEIMLLKAIRVSDNQKVDVALQSLPFGGGRNNVGVFYKEIKKDLYENVADKATLNQKVLDLACHWNKGLQVSYVGSAYSTMTLQKDKKIGFFFEEEPGNYCMVYIPLTLEQMTKGVYKLDEAAYDVPTGIEGVEVDENRPAAIYDLSGRRVAHPTHGVYIINGKKVILK